MGRVLQGGTIIGCAIVSAMFSGSRRAEAGVPRICLASGVDEDAGVTRRL